MCRSQNIEVKIKEFLLENIKPGGNTNIVIFPDCLLVGPIISNIGDVIGEGRDGQQFVIHNEIKLLMHGYR